MLSEYLLLFVLSLLAATVSGAIGFGGAMLLLPVLSNIVGIKEAIPILTIAQIFGNASRVWFGRKDLHWSPILYCLATAIPFSIMGSYLFTEISAFRIKTGIGIILILLVLFRRLNKKIIPVSDQSMLIGGGITGFLSGIAGTAGPLGAAFFIGLRLSPSAYISSEAFTSLIMHLSKTVVYHNYSLITASGIYCGIFMGGAMIAGSWLGRKIVQNIPVHRFVLVVEILLLLSGVQLILTAL